MPSRANRFSFDSETTRRLLNMLRRYERTPLHDPPQPHGVRRGGGGGGGSTQVAKLTSSVSAGSSTAPGSGTATPQKLVSGSYAANGSDVTVYNVNDKTFATGSIVIISKTLDGSWFVVNLDSCSHSS